MNKIIIKIISYLKFIENIYFYINDKLVKLPRYFILYFYMLLVIFLLYLYRYFLIYYYLYFSYTLDTFVLRKQGYFQNFYYILIESLICFLIIFFVIYGFPSYLGNTETKKGAIVFVLRKLSLKKKIKKEFHNFMKSDVGNSFFEKLNKFVKEELDMKQKIMQEENQRRLDIARLKRKKEEEMGEGKAEKKFEIIEINRFNTGSLNNEVNNNIDSKK